MQAAEAKLFIAAFKDPTSIQKNGMIAAGQYHITIFCDADVRDQLLCE